MEWLVPPKTTGRAIQSVQMSRLQVEQYMLTSIGTGEMHTFVGSGVGLTVARSLITINLCLAKVFICL